MSLMVTREEWRWLAGVILAVTALSIIPWIASHFFGPADRVHIGTYFNHWDFGQYAAAMAEGASGPSWLIHDHLTPEPHDPIFMFSLYVAIGKIANALGIPALWVHRLVEVLMRLALPVGLYLFIAAAVDDRDSRRAGFILGLVTGGFTVWLGIARDLFGQGWSTSGEFAAFGALFAAPHIGLGLAAVVSTVVCFGAVAWGRSWYALGLLAGAMLAVGLLYPFYLPVLLGLFAASVVLESIWQRRLQLPGIAALAVGGLVATPFILYHAIVFGLDPFWSQTYGAQNYTPSPPLWELPANLGIAAFLAPVGLAAFGKRAGPQQRLLLVMLALGLVLMYAPVPYQRRFGFALHATLAALAALGWPLVWRAALALAERLPSRARRGQRAFARRLVLYPLLLFGLSTPVVSYLGVVVSAAANYPLPVYALDRDTYEAGRWIAAQSGVDDVTLASYATGNVLGGLVPGRVVIGHETATLRTSDKAADVRAFYRGEMSASDVAAFFTRNRVSYVIVGPEERRIGPFDPGILGLPSRMRIEDAVVFQVP